MSACVVPRLVRFTLLAVFPHHSAPPRYVLALMQKFPLLEPTGVFPVHRTLLDAPLRRDILWAAAVYEADALRVGSLNPKGRSDLGYSRRKLRPQKGTGMARVGDNNSPTRHTGARAFARRAPFDWLTELPTRVYHQAFKTAFLHQYREGHLHIVDLCEIVTAEPAAVKQFGLEHGVRDRRLLFVVSKASPNLAAAAAPFKKVAVVEAEDLEVRDVLKAARVYIEREAFEKLGQLFSKQEELVQELRETAKEAGQEAGLEASA